MTATDESTYPDEPRVPIRLYEGVLQLVPAATGPYGGGVFEAHLWWPTLDDPVEIATWPLTEEELNRLITDAKNALNDMAEWRRKLRMQREAQQDRNKKASAR